MRRPRAVHVLIWGLGLSLLAANGAGADPGPPAAGSQPRPESAAPLSDEEIERLLALHHVDRQKVRLILLPTVVEGKRGKPVRGLKAGDFRLYEDYVPQKIRLFVAEESQPISIAFLLDLSGSMRQVGKLSEAKQAIRGYIAALRPEDRIALIGFADKRVDWITEFTTDRDRFLKGMRTMPSGRQEQVSRSSMQLPI